MENKYFPKAAGRKKSLLGMQARAESEAEKQMNGNWDCENVLINFIAQ